MSGIYPNLKKSKSKIGGSPYGKISGDPTPGYKQPKRVGLGGKTKSVKVRYVKTRQWQPKKARITRK